MLASLIMIVGAVSWRNILVPWYEDRIYRDARIEGAWSGEILFSSGATVAYHLEIKRASHRITGTMTGLESGETYAISGEFKNMLLTYQYESNNPLSIDRGCFSLLLQNNGKKLVGCGAFYYPPNHRIEKADIEYRRRHNPPLQADTGLQLPQAVQAQSPS